VQDVLCFGAVGVELAQTGDDGQSPHEQPREVSPHEWMVAFRGFIAELSMFSALYVMA
jgi:hypothetical protein